MSSLSSKISSVDVKFVLNNAPSIVLTVVTTLTDLEKVDFVGYFAITQPDGITSTGNYTSPDIYYSGSGLVTFEKTLRLDSANSFQKGNYSIVLYCDHPDYTPGTFTRSFEFTYKPVTQVLTENFDVYTPQLQYSDDTVYTKSGWTKVSQTRAWAATTSAGNVPAGTTATFDVSIGGSYYDASYQIDYATDILYRNDSATWLTVHQYFTFSGTSNAYAPQSMATLLGYLGLLKTKKDARPCDNSLNDLYEKAATLYQHIREKVCSRSTTNLKSYFEEFYRLTHNYQTRSYTHTGAVLTAYDFTTGCSGVRATRQISVRPTPGVSSFTVSALAGETITGIARSGRVRGITTSTNTDMEMLQVVGNTITLPTGDVVESVTMPDSTIQGELFVITY